MLQKYDTVDKNDKGDKYCGITLDWDYDARKVHLSIPEYCLETLQQCRHKCTKKDQQHQHTVPMYDVAIQYAKNPDTSPILNDYGKLLIQQVTGTFLNYARAVDSTILVALSTIAAQQANLSEETMRKNFKIS